MRPATETGIYPERSAIAGNENPQPFRNNENMDRSGMKIGVTGGIGSGKTTVCRVFNSLGIPVFSADNEASNIMESDPQVIENVRNIAGQDIYKGGSLNRSELAELIFNDRELLERINQVVHPVVRINFDIWQRSQKSDYVILEAAILFESGSYKTLDGIITVIAPLEERIDRVVRRNNLTREQIMERIRNQSDDEFKIARSDFVIDNSDDQLILPQILRIHDEMLKRINLRRSNG
ncbi:MAG: dephospho-CoA kinase [Bacteroidales bacterium]